MIPFYTPTSFYQKSFKTFQAIVFTDIKNYTHALKRCKIVQKTQYRTQYDELRP